MQPVLVLGVSPVRNQKAIVEVPFTKTAELNCWTLVQCTFPKKQADKRDWERKGVIDREWRTGTLTLDEWSEMFKRAADSSYVVL